MAISVKFLLSAFLVISFQSLLASEFCLDSCEIFVKKYELRKLKNYLDNIREE